MRLMIHSVKPSLMTGYATQTGLLAKALKSAGHEVSISCTCGLTGAVEIWEGIKLYPHSGFGTKYGMDTVGLHIKALNPDLVISWHDAFIIDKEMAKNSNRWLAWVPVDSEPLMSMNKEPLTGTRWQAAPSHSGVKQLQDAGFEKAKYIPCAFDPSRFYPMPGVKQANLLDLSRVLNVDLSGKFLVNIVSSNSGSRKNFPAVFEAWSKFTKDKKDCVLYIHTEVSGYYNQGENLKDMMELYDFDRGTVLFPPQWEYQCGMIPESFLRLLYNASDCHLNTCVGEGFGLPILDAQACGCPVIVPDFASAGEICFNGFKVRGERQYNVPGAFQFFVDVGHVVKCLETMYDHRYSLEERLAVAGSAGSFRIDSVMETYWKPVLADFEEELKDVV